LIFDRFFPENEIIDLASRVLSRLAIEDFRRQIVAIVTITFGVARSNPTPWREQRRGFQRLARAAQKAVRAIRGLDAC
jgi:hypothetical protein